MLHQMGLTLILCGFLPHSVAAPASSAACSGQETVRLRQEKGEEAFRPG